MALLPPILTLIAALALSAQAQGPFYAPGPLDSPRMAALAKAVQTRNGASAQAAFWDEVHKKGAPLVEPVPGEPRYSWVTFLWQAKKKTDNVAIIDGVAEAIGGYDPAKALMTRLADSDVWYRTYKARNDAAFSYLLSPNDSLESLFTSEPRRSKPQPDPLNPRRLGRVSYVELPETPGLSLRSASRTDARGTVERSSFHSKGLNNDRDVWTYTPPGYQRSGGPYALLVVLDGDAYLNQVAVPAILDHLMAQRQIPQMVAVLVGNAEGEREAELTCSKPFTEFLVTEIVPWMRRNYGASEDASETIIAGSSLGGLAAAFAGFEHSEVFGNVLSQSGSYWWSPAGVLEKAWLTRQFAASTRRRMKVSMSVGLMEVPDQLGTNRELHQVLTKKGYVVLYAEFNGNHSYVAWRDDFGERLAALVGGKTGQ